MVAHVVPVPLAGNLFMYTCFIVICAKAYSGTAYVLRSGAFFLSDCLSLHWRNDWIYTGAYSAGQWELAVLCADGRIAGQIGAG